MSHLPSLKEYQVAGLQAIQELRQHKGRPIIAVAPPGAGKSRCMIELAMDETAKGGRTMIKVHRKMLLDQMVNVFNAAGLEIGVISPDYYPNTQASIQIVSAQSLFARGVKSSRIEMPECTLIINDEAHQQSSMVERALIYGSINGNVVQRGYASMGIDVVGFSATPVMKSRIYDQLIDFASYSQLRKQGMHQLVHVYGPDEIDTTGLKTNQAGDFSENKLAERVEVIFGSVYSEWCKLNPQQLPAILFAPSVPSSRWFTTQFFQRGVSVAHIDGQYCLLPRDGKLVQVKSTRESRDEILARSKEGDIKIVMNRFVLREAIDMPWLYHGIFATAFGSLTAYLQSIGRLQRYWPAYTHKILQCHGGNYWRHGSPNEDREWWLGNTQRQLELARIEKVLNSEAAEGIRCPECGFWRKSGDTCFSCKHKHTVSVRAVRQVNGKLKLMKGRVYKKSSKTNDLQKLWTSTLFRAGHADKPVSSAVAMFAAQAAQKGLRIDWTQVNNRPPLPSSVEYDLSVRTVFPWTIRHKSKK